MGEKQGDKKQSNKGDAAPTTMVFKFDMHCEGCAKKVAKSIKKIQGVEIVKTDFAGGKLTVVGNVDALKINEIVEVKIKKKVELLSLQPNKLSTTNNKEAAGGGGGGEKKSDEKNKSDEKKSEAISDDKKSEDKKEKEKPKVIC